MGGDALNALFELGGAVAVWLSVMALYRSKQWEGLSPWNMVFFNAWGLWNLFYYPLLDQHWSFLAGCCLQFSNMTYLYLLWRYRNGRVSDEAEFAFLDPVPDESVPTPG